jgi:hypothetical protein
VQHLTDKQGEKDRIMVVGPAVGLFQQMSNQSNLIFMVPVLPVMEVVAV